jgi:stringent starvation protein B
MDGPPRKLPPKRDVIVALLEKSSARVFLDPRKEAVAVPKGFLKQAELVLRVGYSLTPPIPDLEIGDDHISCTLSFNRTPTWCKLPFAAIYAVISDSDGRGVIWPEDVPVESQLLRGSGSAGGAGAERRNKPPPAKPKLAAVPAREARITMPDPAVEAAVHEVARGDASRDAPAPTAPPGGTVKQTKRPLPPYLRVVK